MKLKGSLKINEIKVASQKSAKIRKTLSWNPKQQEMDETIINQYKMTHEGLRHQILSIGESFSQFRLWACLFSSFPCYESFQKQRYVTQKRKIPAGHFGSRCLSSKIIVANILATYLCWFWLSIRPVSQPRSGPHAAWLSDATSTSGPVLVHTERIFLAVNHSWNFFRYGSIWGQTWAEDPNICRVGCGMLGGFSNLFILSTESLRWNYNKLTQQSSGKLA